MPFSPGTQGLRAITATLVVIEHATFIQQIECDDGDAPPARDTH
jgi:hypothetical protein